MSASHNLKDRLGDLTKCSICLDELVDPRSLPCVHTFCLKCLEGNFQNAVRGRKVPCPVCRNTFRIPVNGIKGLPHNFMATGLLDVKKDFTESVTDIPCEVCLAESIGAAADTPSATMYCVDCRQKVCKRHSTPHRNVWSKPHTVVILTAELKTDLEKQCGTELDKQNGSHCDQHSDKQMEWYCFDCKVNTCELCRSARHENHKYEVITKVIEDFSRQIETDFV
jgi:hypothetical protein